MQLSLKNQQTIRRATNWSIAVALLMMANAVLLVSTVFDGSIAQGVGATISLAVMSWQGLAMLLAAANFGKKRLTTEALNSGMLSLRTYFRLSFLAMVATSFLLGSNCNVDFSELRSPPTLSNVSS